MRKWFYVMLGCGLVVLLAGCMKARTHITIKSNGSADVEYLVTVNRDELKKMQEKESPGKQTPMPKPGDISKQMLMGAESKAKSEGIEATAYQQGADEGVRYFKHVKDAGEIAAAYGSMEKMSNQSGGDGTQSNKLGLTVKKGFFADTYKLHMTMGSDQSSNPMAQAMMSQMSGAFGAQFVLTLPVKPKKSNATKVEDGGKTLIWEVDPMKANTLDAEATNIHFVKIGGIALALLLIVIGIAVLRKKKTA